MKKQDYCPLLHAMAQAVILQVDDVSKRYSKKFTSVMRSVFIVLVFLVSNQFNLPPSFQDILLQMVATVTVAYTVLVHVVLFEGFPVLIIVPTI